MDTLNLVVKNLRSEVAGHVPPTTMAEGQLAIQIADKILFTKDSAGHIQSFYTASQPLKAVATSGSFNDLTDVPTNVGGYTLPPATTTTLGGVIVDGTKGITVDGSGNLTNVGVWNILAMNDGVGTTINPVNGVLTLSSDKLGIPIDLIDGTGHLATKYLPTSIGGALTYQGVWDANANSPAIGTVATTKGQYWVVSVAGTTTLGTISTWAVGDWAIYDGTTWQRLEAATSLVTSVNNQTGAVTITPTSLGLATVATSGDYRDLSNKPAPYVITAATTAALGGVMFNAAAQSPGNIATGVLATVAASGSYTDLLNLPINSPDDARISVNVQAPTNVALTNEVRYPVVKPVTFPSTWTGSVAYAQFLNSGSSGTVGIWKYTSASDTVGTQVGAIAIATDGSSTFSGSGGSFAAGTFLSYRFPAGVTTFAATLAGTWGSA